MQKSLFCQLPIPELSYFPAHNKNYVQERLDKLTDFLRGFYVMTLVVGKPMKKVFF